MLVFLMKNKHLFLLLLDKIYTAISQTLQILPQEFCYRYLQNSINFIPQVIKVYKNMANYGIVLILINLRIR